MFRISASGIGNCLCKVLDTLDLGRVFFGLGVDWVGGGYYILSKSMQTRGKFTFREYIHS